MRLTIVFQIWRDCDDGFADWHVAEMPSVICANPLLHVETKAKRKSCRGLVKYVVFSQYVSSNELGWALFVLVPGIVSVVPRLD